MGHDLECVGIICTLTVRHELTNHKPQSHLIRTSWCAITTSTNEEKIKTPSIVYTQTTDQPTKNPGWRPILAPQQEETWMNIIYDLSKYKQTKSHTKPTFLALTLSVFQIRFTLKQPCDESYSCSSLLLSLVEVVAFMSSSSSSININQ